jgi:hypothetical protein
MEQFEPEKTLIALIARGSLSTEERIKCESLLSADLNWNYAKAQINRHKLLPLFLSHLQSCRIINSSLEVALKEEINNCVQRIKHSRLLDRELCRLGKLLAERDLAYAVLKGPILAHVIYDIPVKRTYGDLDILVKKSDADAVSKILKEQGYIQGFWDKEKKEIVPAPRRVVLGYSLHTHQLYNFRKILEQSLITLDIHVELHMPCRKGSQRVFDIDVSANSPCWQSLEEIKLYGERISTLNWNYFLLQLCLHAYVDEVSIFKIVDDNGGNLRAYCDIRELILSKRAEINFDKFVDVVKQAKAKEPIYYILANLCELYDDMLEILSSILEQIRPKNLVSMNEFGYSLEILGEQRGQYSKPFRERIFDNSPQEDVNRQKHLFRTPQSQLEFFTF